MAKITKQPKLSIICPTLNEANKLPLLIADINACNNENPLHIIDGGSKDKTILIAEIGGAIINKTHEANRGLQLHKGAIEAKGEWLLFLHADSRLHPNWGDVIFELINKNHSKDYAWFFDFKIKGGHLGFKLLEKTVAIRSILIQRPYGDQGLLITKTLYKEVGGYSNLHIMEDLDLVLKISKKTSFKRIGLPIYIDSKKWKKTNIFKQAIKNAELRFRWRNGESSKSLSEEYYNN
tara:strand:- start:878 stop:1585 length:708 start_codon:yes stop_codon:yes gene_type:complete